MKSIVLAEKPSVGREIARVLGCRQKTKSLIEGDKYIVTWAMGHLAELADPKEYDDRYKTWALEYLPMLPDRMKHKVIRKTSHQFRAIKELLHRKDVNNLIIATDAGREGELVARLIMRLGGWKGPFQRLWISSQTDSAIKEGFRNLRNGREYDNLFRAAECRAEADWIIGLNATRALSCKYDVRLSAGRVQTPTLAMITAREEEIKKFIPVAFWTVEADFGPFTGTWQGSKGNTRLKEEASAREIAGKVSGKVGHLTKVAKKEKRINPPSAYDLTALQRDANNHLGFSAKKTLQVLQGLYERHKIVTYPRTDSRFITEDMVPTLRDRLKALSESPLRPHAENLLRGEIKPGKNLVNNAKVTDHHAIIPTEEKVRMERLSGDERALWNLIAGRYLEVLSPPYRYESISITAEVEGERFIARGTKEIAAGWKGIMKNLHVGIDEDEEDLPVQRFKELEEGDSCTVEKISVKQGQTKPPARYTEATLLGAMENPQKFLSDESLKKSIEKGGLGTPATRADIIEKIISNYYVERDGRQLIPTARGIELIDLVPDQFTSPELTARWEQRLDRIALGQEKGSVFINDIRENAKDLIQMIKESKKEYKPRDPSGKKCPMCGKVMIQTKDRRGRKVLVCHSLSCGYEENLDQRAGESRRPGRREQAMNKRLIQEFSDKSKETSSFADLIKAAQERKKKKG